MYICICKAVTDREIRAAVSLGVSSMDQLRRDLGVSSCCGKCFADATRVLQECTGCCGGCAAAGD